MNMPTNYQLPKGSRSDEWYTRLQDVEAEMPRYAEYLKGKKIYCPCDSEESAFVKYFTDNGCDYGIASFEYSSDDFRTHEKEFDYADVVVTNPPFSIKYEFLDMCFKHGVDIICILPMLSGTKVSELVAKKLLRYGGSVTKFSTPTGEEKMVNAYWMTTFPIPYPPELELTASVLYQDYEHCINCNGIYIRRLKDIPKDYGGPMLCRGRFGQSGIPRSSRLFQRVKPRNGMFQMLDDTHGTVEACFWKTVAHLLIVSLYEM